MTDYVGNAAINNRTGTHIQEIIEAIFINLAAHPLINSPPVFDKDNNRVRITLFRDYDGIDLENTGGAGVTLSIFPYSFSNNQDNNLTVNSSNASIVFKPHTIGRLGTPQGPLDEARAHITFKLHVFGYDTPTTMDTNFIENQVTKFQLNKNQQILRVWAETLRMVLVSDLQKLPSVNYPIRNLLSNSFLNQINYGSSKWDDGPNLIFQTATMLWETTYYAKRSLEDWNPVEVIGGNVGSVPDPNPLNNPIPVCYNLAQDRYFNCSTNDTLTRDQLIDPATGTFYTTLATNVIKVVDTINPQRQNFVTFSDQG